eukprot:1391483-Amorphochlora_amoeboformis.AAC.3
MGDENVIKTSRGPPDIENGKSWEHAQLAGMAGAALSGSLLGAIISFTVNCTLVEISVNAFFAVYFGVLFCVIAGWMIWRVYTGEHPRPILLGTYSSLVMLAGLLCFALESNWVINMSASAKVGDLSFVSEGNFCGVATNYSACLSPRTIETSTGWGYSAVPLYSILGIAVTFALLFSIIDLVNFCHGSCISTPGRALVETETQVHYAH